MQFIEEMLKYKNHHFVSTRTYQGETIDIVLKNDFKNIYSMETSAKFYYKCVERFINHKNVSLFYGNSMHDLCKIINNINSLITFWLDSQWSGLENEVCDQNVLCPILYELEQIKNHNLKNHTIIINNVRLMDGKHFEVTRENVEKKIFEINKNYSITYYDTQNSKNDILVAHLINESDNKIEKKLCIHNYLKVCKTNPQPPGFGDFIRGTIALFNYSKKYGYDLYIDNSHEIFQNLLENEKIIKNKTFNETIELLPPNSYCQIDFDLNELFLKGESFCIMTNAFYTRNSDNRMDNFGDVREECKKFLRQILTPNNFIKEAIKNVYSKLNIDVKKGYSVIHLRLGDRFIYKENDRDEEIFKYLNEKIKTLIINNKNTQFILLSDSSCMSETFKSQNPELFYWKNKKIHLGDLKSSDVKNSVTDTLIDFFIMTKSDKIYYYSFMEVTGFSKMVSLVYDKEYINL
jgi:hypothetical protein